MTGDTAVRTMQCLMCDETWDALGRYVWTDEKQSSAYWRPKLAEARCPECGCTEATQI